MAITKYRADELVYQQGLAESKEKAKRLIMAGKIVIVDPLDQTRSCVSRKHVF